MKKDIHPKYEKTIVTCSCGNTFETKSTVPEISVEICSVCHPFYTGKQKLVDTAGRVDKFRSRMLKMEELKSKKDKKSETTPKKSETIEEIKEEIAEETVEIIQDNQHNK